jgi:hypothetical protein
MKLFEIISKELDPDIYKDIDPGYIAKIAKSVFNKMYPDAALKTKSTPEGYAELTAVSDTGNDFYISIGCSIADSTISINLSGGPGTATAGDFKGAITAIINKLYNSVVKKYGVPKTPGDLTIDYDAGQGVWQHIADKLGLTYSAHQIK